MVGEVKELCRITNNNNNNQPMEISMLEAAFFFAFIAWNKKEQIKLWDPDEK